MVTHCALDKKMFMEKALRLLLLEKKNPLKPSCKTSIGNAKCHSFIFLSFAICGLQFDNNIETRDFA